MQILLQLTVNKLILCVLVVRLIWHSRQSHCWPLQDWLWKGRLVHVVCELLW